MCILPQPTVFVTSVMQLIQDIVFPEKKRERERREGFIS
jgi:hypothetical protein